METLPEESEWKYKEYLKIMADARKNDEDSFIYKNIKYVKVMTPSGTVIYVRNEKKECQAAENNPPLYHNESYIRKPQGGFYR